MITKMKGKKKKGKKKKRKEKVVKMETIVDIDIYKNHTQTRTFSLFFFFL